MSRRLAPVSQSDLIRRMRRLGWEGPIHGSKHPYITKGGVDVRIPNPHSHQDVGVGLLRGILREAGISRTEWLGLS